VVKIPFAGTRLQRGIARFGNKNVKKKKRQELFFFEESIPNDCRFGASN